MAFGRLERSRSSPPMSDINMTPLIDVMLVLLVIFMITAPLMGSSLKLELPRTRGATANAAPAPLVLSLDAKGHLFLADQPISADQLRQKAQAAAQANPATEVQLRADTQVPYGQVAELIGLLQEAGLRRVGFVTRAASAQAAASS